MIFTHSSIDCFCECNRKYQYRYLQKISPVTVSDALTFGSEMHNVLEKIFNFVRDFPPFAWEDETFLLKIVDDEIEAGNLSDIDKAKLKGLAYGYINKYFYADIKQYEVIDIEKEFCLRLPNGQTFVGKADGILRERETGKYYILEHKTAANVDDSYKLQKTIDSQTLQYAIAFERLNPFAIDGFEISGAIHDIITKQKIRLKKGETESDFCQRLIDDVTDDNFMRIVVEFSVQDKEEAFRELTTISETISHAVEQNVLMCKSTFNCLGKYGCCDYLPLCQRHGQLDGCEKLFVVKREHEEISEQTINNITEV